MSAVKSYGRAPSKRQKVQRAPKQAFGVQRVTFGMMGIGLCILSVWGYFHASTFLVELSRNVEQTFALFGFRLEDVVVEGRMRTDKTQILKMLDLKRDQPLLSINLLDAKEKLEKISWVKAVRVERRFPDTLFIRISEKEPVALWQNQSKTYLVDRDGELVEVKEAHKYNDLLLVAGHEAPHEVGKLLTLLEEFPELKTRVTAATHLRSMRWDIKLDGKIDVKLPEKEADRALAYLLNLEKNHRLMNQEVMSIDMRLPGQLILRLAPEAVSEKNGTGKDV